MKKQTYLLIFLLFASPFFASSQEKNYGKAETYLRFFSTWVKLSNNFTIADSSIKTIPTYIQSPFKTQNFLITGADLKVDIFNQDFSDSISHFWMAHYFIDTVKADSNFFSFENLQVKVSVNGKIKNDWNNVNTYPSFYDSSILINGRNGNVKKSYHIVNGMFNMGDVIEIEMKRKNSTQSILHLNIKRINLPLQPFLAQSMHDSSTTRNENDFIQGVIKNKDFIFERINSFYKNWPPGYGGGGSIGTYFPSSKLAFYFRKYDAGLPDYSLEYRLLDKKNLDTAWHKSGHLILVTKVQANTQYLLQVRYTSNPENIWFCTFNVKPFWYQTSLFKWIGITAIILLLAISIIILIYKRKIKSERLRKDKLNLELKSLRSQLNPHFIFNALGSIQGLMNSNDIGKANQYLSEFSVLLRDALKNNDKDFNPLVNEIKLMETYIKLEQLRFNFDYVVSTDNNLNGSEIEIPSLLIQPLIENAIKHGISYLKEKGKLQVDFYSQDKNLYIKIEDNGKGYDTSLSYEGFGLKLTGERIKLINQGLKEQSIQIKTESNCDNNTAVILIFQNWLL